MAFAPLSILSPSGDNRMAGEDEARRIALNLACVAAIAAAAPPMGWMLAQWVILGKFALLKSPSDLLLILPNAATLALAIMAVTKMPRGPVRLLVPVAILALLAVGAWQGVAAGANAYLLGPLNAAL